jgi:hypothetical protein
MSAKLNLLQSKCGAYVITDEAKYNLHMIAASPAPAVAVQQLAQLQQVVHTEIRPTG